MPPFWDYSLRRSPLSPGVPLEGSDSVPGLRALDRLRSLAAGDAAQHEGGEGYGRPVENGRRYYRRYKGPFLEQLTLDDAQAAPKPWAAFAGSPADYSVPASVAALQERMEENLATYLPNYIRVCLAILLLVMYLRPPALLGTAAMAATVYFNARRALRRQEQQLRQQQERQQQGRGAAGPPPPAADDEEQQLPLAALSTVATWLLVSYTRCFPMVLLSLGLSATAVWLHAGLRKAHSEARHRGKQPLGYSLREVLGLAPPPCPDADPRLLLRQAGWLCRGWVVRRGRQSVRWARYVLYSLQDSLRLRGLR